MGPLDGSPGVGGRLQPYREVASLQTATINAQENGVRVVCLGAATLNLPPLASVGDGFEMWVIANAGATLDVTIDPDGAELINGGATLVLTTANFEAVRIVKRAGQWTAGVA